MEEMSHGKVNQVMHYLHTLCAMILFWDSPYYKPIFLESDRLLNRKSYWFTVHWSDRWSNR